MLTKEIARLERKAKKANDKANACTHMPMQRAGHLCTRDAYRDAIELLKKSQAAHA